MVGAVGVLPSEYPVPGLALPATMMLFSTELPLMGSMSESD
jgi:hypothetical protein